MALSAAVCWCAHCGALRRLRAEGDYASCGACGKVLLELRGDAAGRRLGVCGNGGAGGGKKLARWVVAVRVRKSAPEPDAEKYQMQSPPSSPHDPWIEKHRQTVLT
ncbi:unnamed protein product [Urochloa humidicola]